MNTRQELTRLLEELERDGTSVMALVRGNRTPEAWTLYPDEYGVFDRRTRCQFYYHSHGATDHEDGHFHTVRLFDEHTVHLVAISMASSGWPQALFTLNLWAIGDRHEPPGTVKAYTRAFRLRPGHGEPRVVHFVNLVFEVFRREIEWLQDEKARALEAYRIANPGLDPFEDRALEVLSRLEIDVRDPQPVPAAVRG